VSVHAAAVASLFRLTEELASDERYRLYRGRRDGEPDSVLIKVPARAPAFAADIADLRREFEILHSAPVDAITRALDFVDVEHHWALVLEDHDDRPLATLIAARSPPLGWVLDYAVQLVAALAGLHRAGIMHRGINPRSILVNDRSGRLRLTDFSEAARTAAEACVPLAPHRYRTRLPYAAPEQTGRVNRNCDYRTDFYSLGVLLYELLTGRRPFATDDPLELMHAHIARMPPAPCDVVAAVPPPLSQIVMKLLAKPAEERYQSAHCLEQDLSRCRREWSERGRVTSFQIAARDVSERFAVPQRLYGRDAESAQLRAALDQARSGQPTLLLVDGYAGIGKTVLIRELHEPVARCGGKFVSGKFDQLSRDVPYGALIQALRQLMQRTLAATPAQLERDSARLDASLGANAAVIAEVIPEIELLLGPQRHAPALPPAEARNRFTLAFQNFVAALATADSPLAIFLDDLQWVDPATLQLLAALLTSPQIRYLLLIGAYRSNEIGTDHPLLPALAGLERSGVRLQRITLPPLELAALTQLTADTLHIDRERAEPLARALQVKTSGNPFFITQFLSTLHQEGLIEFDPAMSAWKCALESIASAPLTDNVVDLMSRKIERLLPATQRALTLAACIGNRFDAHTLSIVSDQSLPATLSDLAEAVAENLIVPEADNVFVFLHDRVQQAAYARIAQADKPQAHLTIGRLLWAQQPLEALDTSAFDRIFDTASHLNLGAHLIDSTAEKLALARVNLAAGNMAKSSAAHRTALGYFTAGSAVLDEQHWQTGYDLTFALGLEAAQCEYLCGEFDAAQRRFAALLRQAATDLDRARVFSLQMVQFENMARFSDALDSARAGLRLFGVSLPESAAEKLVALDAEIDSIQSLMGVRAIESLIDLPTMTDPAMKMLMRILTGIWSSVYILGDAVLARLISATLVRLSLQHGISEESAYGFVTHAITAGPVRHDYRSAWEWGNLALQVNERFNDLRLRAKIHQQFHAHVNYWRRPFASCIPYAKEACRSGLESGDFVYAAYAASTESWPAFVSTQDLAQLVNDLKPNLALITRLKNDGFADALRLVMNWARALQGETVAPLSLSDQGFDEQRYVEMYRDNPFFSMFHAIARLHLSYTLGDEAGALHAARSVRATAHQLTGMVWSVVFQFWSGLTVAATFADANADERAAGLEELHAAHRHLAVLADNCPENFQCHALLLHAELERISQRPWPALELYERAVTYADQTAMVQHQALANELFARFWLERGNRTVASVYLRKALERYATWGAHAKVGSLVERYGELLGAPPIDPAIKLTHETLDIATIGKAAHAISANVELESLIRQMLTLAIENAGATSGVMIDDRDGKLCVAAHGRADTGEVVLLRERRLDEGEPCCSSAVVNYVSRTLASLVISDPELDERFAQDDYVITARPKSILCLPIVQQGKRVAVLYLENRFARDAFSADRVEAIRILSAQAAIALESARLAHRMNREIAERRRAEERLRAIEAGTASVTGGDFFRALVRNLASALHVRYAFAAECLRDDAQRGKIVRSRAFWKESDFGENFEFAVPGTPCQQVVEGETCHYASDVQLRFPADKGLATWNAQSYLGMPLVGSNGAVIGHVAILDTEEMPDATMAVSVLRLSAGRAGAELERLKADEGLRRALEEVEQLKNRLQEENVYLRRELIANVSHDLRSPLASLRGYLDTLLIKEKSLTATERRSYVAIAARQAEHLQALISELFDLARLDFVGYRINAEPVHLGELARDVSQKFQLAAKKKQVTLKLEADGDAGFVNADIGLIERTLENLLENSLAHTPPKGCVRLTVRADDGGGVTLAVSDTGSGIPPADLPHIFERFYRVDKARTRESIGSGLGLAIVKRIVELHNSEVHVESSAGTGTTFWFTLTAAPMAPLTPG